MSATSHAAPTTALSRLRDLLHAAYLKLPQRFRRADTGRHQYRARPRGAAPMMMSHGLVGWIVAERNWRENARQAARESRALLRAECDRMALLLNGVRRGRADAARLAHAVARPRALCVPVRARQRFAAAAGHTRTAARETAAVAARAVRQVGAHRHVKGVNDAAHNLAASALAMKNDYARRGRAFGENPWWRQGMRVA